MFASFDEKRGDFVELCLRLFISKISEKIFIIIPFGSRLS